tara:strand:- start:17810 stop:18349 length:540 start_codon:yes stop_codon:yes gene_type:complete
MGEIYQPGEDSYFFSEFLEKYFSKLKHLNIDYLDMGAATGILSETAAKFIPKKNILTIDINVNAINILRKKGFNAIKSDLFEKVDKKFDIITFNAPYLPEDFREPKNSRIATTGGKGGDEISIRFLKEAKKYLKNGGKSFLLVSNLTPFDKIKEFGVKIVKRKKLFLEELFIIEVSLKK